MVVFVVGFLGVGGALLLEFSVHPPYWLQIMIWAPITVLLSIGFLRPPKTLMVKKQYRFLEAAGALPRNT